MLTRPIINNSPSIVGAKLVQQIGQRVPKLHHSLCRNGNLRSRSTAGYRLRHLYTIRCGFVLLVFVLLLLYPYLITHPQKPTARVLLQIQIVPSIVLDHHVRPQLAVLRHIVRIRRAQLRIVVGERAEVIAELGGRRQCQEDLAASAVGADFGHLDEAATPVLLDVQIEALRLDLEHFGGQLLFGLRRTGVAVTKAAAAATAAAVMGRVAAERAGKVFAMGDKRKQNGT